ncbi:MAG: Asp-tRNA(Asn)/Glu-tRNA(Gln) amidotransferase subunit GatC [Deltaproteobacteria bacterium]|nr:Asp-tRNA(Asn)/Glu-tRNA(Gln) amidotransferase subunit GatC [Deltaproteobacteria bacterium]
MSLEDIKKTAALALLDIDEPEKLEGAFAEMLVNFEKMMEVDISSLEPTTHALSKGNRLRDDIVTNSDNANELVSRSKDSKGRFFKIPNVL